MPGSAAQLDVLMQVPSVGGGTPVAVGTGGADGRLLTLDGLTEGTTGGAEDAAGGGEGLGSWEGRGCCV